MKKKLFLFIGIAALSLSLFSCGNSNDEKFEVKEVNFYKKPNEVDKKIKLRFYQDTPSIPYIGVNEFYNNFYKQSFKTDISNDTFRFSKYDSYISIDTNNDILIVYDINTISEHPDFKETVSTTYIKGDKITKTPMTPKTVNLKSYNIDAHKGDGDAYLPITLISNLFTGTTLFSIVYNEKDLYEFDYSGQLSDSVSRMESYYGKSYLEPMCADTERSQDMIDFSYNLIRLMIEHFRGYTSQMKYIDNNILSIGLDGTLERYYPRTKELLLSKKRDEYCAGNFALFLGLYDGGHTALMSSLSSELLDKKNKTVLNYFTEGKDEEYEIFRNVFIEQAISSNAKKTLETNRKAAFNLEGDTKYYYYADAVKDIAFIGFDSFEVDYSGWDKYYKDLKEGKKGEIPTSNDTYSYVREKLYEALNDEISTVVIDLSTNGGGDSGALAGIVGLLNQGKGTLSFSDVINKYRSDASYLVDINLDGVYDAKDANEANKFKELNIVILTSELAFSCGNLLPSLLKELGYYTIGEKTGGGSCAIMLGSSGDGISYIRSSYSCLANQEGLNIDGGVPVDGSLLSKPIPYQGRDISNYEYFFNIDYILNVIKDL